MTAVWATARGPELPWWGEVILAVVAIPTFIWFAIFVLKHQKKR